MLREFASRDTPELLPLLLRHFPEEEALIGRRPEAYDRIIRRILRFDARLALGFLRLIGRPVFRFFVIESDGRLAATTLVTFTRRAGFVSTVMVDTPFRRRGYARQLVERAAEVTRRTGRRFLALDVLVDNAPAIALYRSMRFGRLRTLSYMVREGPISPPVEPGGPFRLRRIVPSDVRPLLAVAAETMPPAVAEVLPPEAGQFSVHGFEEAALESEGETWVVEANGSAAGFLKTTVSRSVESGYLSQPLLGAAVPDPLARHLVATGVEWLTAHGKSRIVTEVAEYNEKGRRALEAEGFREAHRVDTLVLRL